MSGPARPADLIDLLVDRARVDGALTVVELRTAFEDNGIGPADAGAVLRRLTEAGAVIGSAAPSTTTPKVRKRAKPATKDAATLPAAGSPASVSSVAGSPVSAPSTPAATRKRRAGAAAATPLPDAAGHGGSTDTAPLDTARVDGAPTDIVLVDPALTVDIALTVEITLPDGRQQDAKPAGPAATPTTAATTTEASPSAGEAEGDAEDEGAPAVAEEDQPIALDEAPPGIDLVKAYLREIGKVALLTAVEEVELSKRIEAGLFAAEKLRSHHAAETKLASALRRDLTEIAVDGERAKRHLLEANLRLVVSLAKRYQGRGLDLLDLVQEGNLGLVRAVEKFDYAKGYKFSTYATWWIRQALQRALADQGRTIRVPVHMAELITKVTRVRRELTQTLGREPLSEEIAGPLDMTAAKVEEILGYGRDTLSLESPVGDDEAVLGDFITDSDSPDPVAAVEMQMLQGQLSDVLAGLPTRSAVVMRMRFGLDDGRSRTLDEVGRHLGLTRERIRQIERDTLAELRAGGQAEALREFVA